MMNLVWLIVLVTVMIVVQGLFFRHTGPRRLSYEREFSVSKCYEGDHVEMIERIANRKPLPVPWVRLESSLSANLKFMRQRGHAISEGDMYQNHRSLFSLMPYTKVVRRHKLVCARRGVYHLNSATLTIGDLFGIFNMYQMQSMQLQLIVYPKPSLPHASEIPSHSWQGDVTVRRWIVHDPFHVAGIREYEPGDSMADVHWKATARSGRLQVIQHDYTADRRVMVILNVEDHEKMWSTVTDVGLIERGISYAAGLIERTIMSGMEAGFASNGCASADTKDPVRIEPRAGRGHFELVLEGMARMEIVRVMPFESLLEQEIRGGRTNTDIVILSSYMNDALQRLSEQLRQRGNSLVVIPLIAEKAKPNAMEGIG